MKVRFYGGLSSVMVVFSLSQPAISGEADVEAVKIARNGEAIYRFDVTLRHDDQGWDHYADRWEVVAPDGTLLGSRVLLHPHENEQPFTRSLDGVAITPDIEAVTIRGHDNVHAFGGKEMTVELPQK